MDIAKFSELVEKTFLPFIYCNEKLNDNKCQNILRKVNPDGSVLAVILEDGFGNHGLVITEKGIWFSVTKGKIYIVIPKNKGAYLFNDFILHGVSVKKTLLGNYDIEFVFWDKNKNKSFEFQFELNESYADNDKTSCKELSAIFESLISKTGKEYVSPSDAQTIEGQPSQPAEKEPNTFDFEYSNFHTVVTLKEDAVDIKNFKVDEKTKIQTPKGNPVTIPLSSIASIQNGRSFSISTLIKFIGGGLLLFFWLLFLIHFVVGFIAFLISVFIGFCLAFPGTLIIIRKDGTKFTTRFYGKAKNNPEYERFVNKIFTANISAMTLDDNQILKKIDNHKKLIGICLIALLVITIIVTAASPSTSKLEKDVWTSIEEELNIQISDLQLIKLSKGKYSGTLTIYTIAGGYTFDITVVTDGKKFTWQLDP
jgi:hypothetical protein